MFGFIKKIFSSIIAFFRGLLGGKKSEGEQSDAPKAKRKNGYFLELDESQNGQSEAAAPAASQTAQQKKQEPAQAAPAPSQAPKPEKNPQPATATANTQNGQMESQPEQTFAPNYLTPTASKGRRGPGPSMEMYRNMARQTKK